MNRRRPDIGASYPQVQLQSRVPLQLEEKLIADAQCLSFRLCIISLPVFGDTPFLLSILSQCSCKAQRHCGQFQAVNYSTHLPTPQCALAPAGSTYEERRKRR